MRLQHRSGCARRLRTPLVIWLGFRAGLFNFGGAALLYWLLYPASSQELHQHTHDGEVGHFYQTWMRPGDFGLGIPHRKNSCCNEKDCHPVEGRYVPEGPEGGTVLEIRVSGRWVKVPRDRILPEPSPDGGTHACYSDPAPFMTETSGGLIIRCVMIGGFS